MSTARPLSGSSPIVRSPDGAARSSSARSTLSSSGGEVLGDRGPVLTALEVRPVAADPHHDRLALGVGPDGDGVHLALVDLPEVRGHVFFEAAGCSAMGRRRAVPAEVETGQPGEHLLRALGDLVEVVLHRRREAVVDEVAEVALEQTHHGEGGERRHEGRALLPHVSPVLDGPQDAGVGRRPSDAELLERLHQRRLGVAGGRLGGVRAGLEVMGRQRVAFGQGGQLHVAIGALLLVGPLDIGAQEAGEA